MAKKRKRQEEKKGELEYKPPEFDRLGYVRTEVGVSKATIIAALFAIPIGLAAMFVMPVGGVAGGLLAGLGGMSLLWFLLPMLKIDVRNFKWTQTAGVLSTNFLVFLAVWVVACNPPFNDFASPEIVDVQIDWGWGSTYVNATDAGSLEARIPVNVTDITVRALITDNVDVDDGTVNIIRGSQAQTMAPETGDSDNNYYVCPFSGIVPVEHFGITATDINGNSLSDYEFSINYL
jgi:hypothetical protein